MGGESPCSTVRVGSADGDGDGKDQHGKRCSTGDVRRESRSPRTAARVAANGACDCGRRRFPVHGVGGRTHRNIGARSGSGAAGVVFHAPRCGGLAHEGCDRGVSRLPRDVRSHGNGLLPRTGWAPRGARTLSFDAELCRTLPDVGQFHVERFAVARPGLRRMRRGVRGVRPELRGARRHARVRRRVSELRQELQVDGMNLWRCILSRSEGGTAPKRPFLRCPRSARGRPLNTEELGGGDSRGWGNVVGGEKGGQR